MADSDARIPRNEMEFRALDAVAKARIVQQRRLNDAQLWIAHAERDLSDAKSNLERLKGTGLHDLLAEDAESTCCRLEREKTEAEDSRYKKREQAEYYDSRVQQGAGRALLSLSILLTVVPVGQVFWDRYFLNGVLIGVIASWLVAFFCWLWPRRKS